MALSKGARLARNKYMAEYKARNREKANAYYRKWRQDNPDKVRKYNQDYWERKASEYDRAVESWKDYGVTDNVTDKNNRNTCPMCDQELTGRQSYCSPACKQKAYRQSKK